MATTNLTAYLPKPRTINVGDWTLVSPVPSVEVGKTLTAYQAALATATQRTIDSGNADKATEYTVEALNEAGLDPDLNLTGLLLDKNTVDAAVKAGIPAVVLDMAVQYAFTYWIMGAEAAEALVKAEYGVDEKSNTSAPKGRKRSKSGKSTGSGKKTQ